MHRVLVDDLGHWCGAAAGDEEEERDQKEWSVETQTMVR
jgi:hypothetical protein